MGLSSESACLTHTQHTGFKLWHCQISSEAQGRAANEGQDAQDAEAASYLAVLNPRAFPAVPPTGMLLC